MPQCEYCRKETQKQKVCPDCGTTIYSAMGKIICGPTAKDMSYCSIAVTDKNIIISRMSKGEVNAKRYSGAGGLIGVLIVDAATTKTRECGYYPLKNIQKGIFPYLATGIKKKNAIKLINNDGTDFILIVDQPTFYDSVWKALKKTVAAIGERIPLMEDGSNTNFGNTICTKPYVTLENFDKIKPEYAASASAVSTAPAPQQTSVTQPQPVVVTPLETASNATAAPKANSSPVTITCNNCGCNTPLNSKFCNKCGSKIEVEQPKEALCLQCGKKLNDDSKFCHYCGAPVIDKSAEKTPVGDALDESISNTTNDTSKATAADIVEAVTAIATTLTTAKCTNCGATVSLKKNFCNQCGQKIEPVKVKPTHCSQCSERLEENDKFCSNCGYKVE
ncbi:MAG: zinc ribbon domain-containing protein [Clostridia bacterium]|nr:zinc ribbon domain-containing protein [Clostridia bacterium]